MSGLEIAFAPRDSPRITSADEGRFLHFRDYRSDNVRAGAGEHHTTTAGENHSAASRLSRRIAEL
jgi:hypothetical protein